MKRLMNHENKSVIHKTDGLLIKEGRIRVFLLTIHFSNHLYPKISEFIRKIHSLQTNRGRLLHIHMIDGIEDMNHPQNSNIMDDIDAVVTYSGPPSGDKIPDWVDHASLRYNQHPSRETISLIDNHPRRINIELYDVDIDCIRSWIDTIVETSYPPSITLPPEIPAPQAKRIHDEYHRQCAIRGKEPVSFRPVGYRHLHTNAHPIPTMDMVGGCFKGWNCMAGVEGLFVGINGDIYKALCHVGSDTPIGSIYDDHIPLTDEPIMCNKDACIHFFDVLIPKECLVQACAMNRHKTDIRQHPSQIHE